MKLEKILNITEDQAVPPSRRKKEESKVPLQIFGELSSWQRKRAALETCIFGILFCGPILYVQQKRTTDVSHGGAYGILFR